MITRPDPAARLAAVHVQLIDAVEALVTGEEWQRMLTVAARFPTYSTGNVLLIGVQRPDATRVAGIRTWNSLGRRVRRGEKGIAILAPCLYRPRGELDTVAPPRRRDTRRPGDADWKAASTPTAGGSDGSTVPTQRELRGFRVAFVFDVQQTEGEPLAEVAPAELKLAAPEHLVDRLRDLLRADGYTVRDGPCGTAYGYTDFATRTVQIREGVSGGQAAKTLAHEIGHTRADHETRFLAEYGSSMACRAQAEVEAESIAYLVTSAAGLPTDGYSVPYLAGWSGGNADLLRDAATRVLTTARGIVHDLGLDQPAPTAARPEPTYTPTLPSPGPTPAITPDGP